MQEQDHEFVELDRTYHELRYSEGGDDEGAYSRPFHAEAETTWIDLVAQKRIVVLANAGSGKTTEIRRIAEKLRKDGKPAFFLRIEHIANYFEDAFEVGSLDEFNEWIASGSEGWLLLDSVDEAKLRDPFDFERAIKKLGRLLAPIRQVAHVLLTGRAGAWRAKTDLALSNDCFPLEAERRTEEGATDGDAPDEFDTVPRGAVPSDTDSGFKVVGLDDLSGKQVEVFARANRVDDVARFLEEVEHSDAWHLTTRPQDLEDLIGFWKLNKRIGSRSELMESSVERRLTERDSRRAEVRPLSRDRARRGALLVAAACTLTQQSAIKLPGSQPGTPGLLITEILSDWNESDCLTLLNRPIFDSPIYDAVRFHHRSVREFLTAEWLASLIVDQTSRHRVEALFFRKQYDIEVVVPSMRPVLPWLAMRDQKILERVCLVAPEVVLEGGDPNLLPLELRREILNDVCEKIAQPANRGSYDDNAAVQRFANEDLAAEIKELLLRHASSENVVFFLMRMILHGRLKSALPEAKSIAISSRLKYVRIAAIRAVQAVGAASDSDELRTAFANEAEPLLRDWISELIPPLPRSRSGLDWLLLVLGKSQEKERYSIDYLTDEVCRYIEEIDLDLLADAIPVLQAMFGTPPVYERREVEISLRYTWLAKPIIAGLLRLIDHRHQAALSRASLAALRTLPLLRQISGNDAKDGLERIPPAVASWPELNHALFWYDVEETRRTVAKRGERLTDYWTVGLMGRAWSFEGQASFEIVFGDVERRTFIDDKLVALRLAFALYVQSRRPKSWLGRLKRAIAGNQELEVALGSMLGPPKRNDGWKRTEARWKRKQEARRKAEEAAGEDWRQHLRANLDLIRSENNPASMSGERHYLYSRMHEKEGSSGKWALGKWELLEKEFGEEVALAFRDGAIAFWRTQKPALVSEGANTNSTPFSVTLGLAGLAIEARSRPGWAGRLTSDEAEVAARYAIWELNGFPDWLPELYVAHPDTVFSIFQREIEHELRDANEEQNRFGLVYDLSWAGSWMFDRLGPVMNKLLKRPMKNSLALTHVLSIVCMSGVKDGDVANVLSQMAIKDWPRGGLWFAAWTGVNPELAIPIFKTKLAGLPSEEATLLAMQFITSLVGARGNRRIAREKYKQVPHLKSLYLLLNGYIHESEDINRAGTGVYTPELRDDAQDARNSLFAAIKEIPGKEAYLALRECAIKHPSESARPWMAYHARTKAAQDADLQPWNIPQVREFANKLERTPSNHRDLWEIALDRLQALRHDLEHGDQSYAKVLQSVDDEVTLRNFIGGHLRNSSAGRYIVTPEEELADLKRPDLRFHGIGFDNPVPVELKIADKWTGPDLFERLENQLSGDYLRDIRSSRGVFLVVYRGKKTSWQHPNGTTAKSFGELVSALSEHWRTLASQFEQVDDLAIVGIDLTARSRPILR